MAHEGNLRSRAVFKLEQLDRRERLFRPGQRIVDLGAAPGGWSQYLARRLGRTGQVVAVDLLPMKPVEGVTIIEGDFLDASVLDKIVEALGGRAADAVLSDMAPNLSGVRDRDEARTRELVDAALVFAGTALRVGGLMVVKIFEGRERVEIVSAFKQRFDHVAMRKPEASRSGSAECYVVAKGYNPSIDPATGPA
jgi:23S rRNA (uridine2552-2'-O)-methyltransferase